jgi:hypothetical protein
MRTAVSFGKIRHHSPASVEGDLLWRRDSISLFHSRRRRDDLQLIAQLVIDLARKLHVFSRALVHFTHQLVVLDLRRDEPDDRLHHGDERHGVPMDKTAVIVFTPASSSV